MQSGMKAQIETNALYEANLLAPTPIIINQGGTGSGKTYAILQAILKRAWDEKLHISVCSLTMPHLKRGALRDWLAILHGNGIYQDGMYNRTDQVFKIQDSTVEFFSLDAPGKARGPRRDILFINEANLVPLETYRQLELRTKKTIYLDYNPADEFHWIYDELVDANRRDVTFIKSTYKQNTFLSPREIANIERYREADENYWRVYGLGERGSSRATVYTHLPARSDGQQHRQAGWNLCDALPEAGEEIWGMDFGYNNPAAMVQVRIYDDDIYVRERFYRSHSTNAGRIRALQEMGVAAPIYADAAEPEYIAEIYAAGFDIHAADKDVKKGLDTIRSRRLFITRDSVNLVKEIKSYKYREDANGRILEEPVKLNDHLCDALRYAVHTYFGDPDRGRYAVA